MKKTFLISYIISSCAFLISLIIYVVLSILGTIKFQTIGIVFNVAGFFIELLPILFLKFTKTKVNLIVLILYQIFIILAILIGSVWKVYDLIPYYDTLVHGISGVIITLIAYSIFISHNQNKMSIIWLLIISFCICVSFGALWEIWEFATDGILQLNSQRFADILGNEFIGRLALLDTMIDIISNTIGALIGLLIIFYIEKTQHKKKINGKISKKCK